MNVRVRYAPSPTGLQHIGGVRTALFNYFFSRASHGTFILRVEDTDRTRTTPEAMEDLQSTFEWLGIMWDEGPGRDGGFGPYVQSERKEIYNQYIHQLIDSDHVYRCFCSEERVERVRETQRLEKQKIIGYDRHCRDIPRAESQSRAEDGEPYVVRFKLPLAGKTEFEDILLGRIARENVDINPDPVMIKQDGFPTYHFANVVDDHLMEISHIMRGQEWLPSGPLHALIYQAFGWTPPLYCHLPMILGTDGKKLGKRHGSTSLREFRAEGYLPETMINSVSLLGWAYDESRELFSKAELEELFSLERINKAPAVFDYKKLEWFNGNYIRERSHEELAELMIPFLVDAGMIREPLSEEMNALVLGIAPLVKERLKTLSEVPEMVKFLFADVELDNVMALVPKKMDIHGTLSITAALRTFLPGFAERDDDANEALFRKKAEELGVKLGNLLMPLRVALTGTQVSPPLIESMRLLGEEKTLERLDRAIRLLEKEG